MGIYKIRTDFGHHLKWLMGVLAVIFIIGGVFMFSGMPGGRNGAEPGGKDEVVATVNGMPITRSEMESTWAQTVEMLRNQGMNSTLQFASQRARVFQQLVDSRIMLASADAMGVEISNKAVNAKRDEMIEDFLKDNRRKVLGNITPEEDRSDPRSDSQYKSELANVHMSIGQVEQQAASLISDGQIRYQLAQDGVRKALEEKAGKATPAEIKDSYNVYSTRQIEIPKSSMPAEQLKTRIDKIEADLKSGGDFAALAKQYSMGPSKGGVQSVSYGMVSPEVWDQLAKLKQGEVSKPIESDQTVYVVKVEGIKLELPKTFDKKTQDERAKMISNMRQMQVYMKYDREIRQKLNVQVTDPEMLGYWHLSQLQQSRPGSNVDPKKEMSLATSAFKKAVGKDPGNQWATAMLAVLLQEQGKNDEAIGQLYHLLEGESSKGEGADLRIMLGDLLWKSGKKDEAAKQYGKAAEAAGVDVSAHAQLIAKFKEIGRPELAAEQQKWLDEYQAKKKLYDAQQAKSGAPAPRKP